MRVLVYLSNVEQHLVAADHLTKLTSLQLILDGCGHCVVRCNWCLLHVLWCSRMQGSAAATTTTTSRENGRNVPYLGAREMALHSSEKDRSDAIAAVRCVTVQWFDCS